MRMFPLITKKDYHTMAYLSRGPREYAIIMTSITAEEEKKLDEREAFGIERGGRLFPVGPGNVKYYGEIDFHQGSDDYKVLEESTLFFPMSLQGVFVPGNYDYEKHCCYSDYKTARWFDTVNAAMICQYAHGILNKPKRVVIFEV